MQDIKKLLDEEVKKRDTNYELTYEKADPLIVAKRQKDEFAILLCALFAYGNAKQIVKFLDTLNFELLDENEEKIEKELQNLYYRFQNNSDIVTIFKALRRLKQTNSLQNIFLNGYQKNGSILDGIDETICQISKVLEHTSQGYNFLISNPFKRDKNGNIKEIGNAPYKRWNMYLRWMVRYDKLDLGMWKSVDKKDLILPLDTHTFKVSQKIGLLQRTTYDLKSALLITQKLKEFDALDPIKYDFALYRIGQEKIL